MCETEMEGAGTCGPGMVWIQSVITRPAEGEVPKDGQTPYLVEALGRVKGWCPKPIGTSSLSYL